MPLFLQHTTDNYRPLNPQQLAALTLDIIGRPGNATGEVRVVHDGGQTAETVDLEVTVNLPVIGGKVAGIIVEQFVAAVEAEYAVGKAWLAGER
jgi:Protein of unknown function (DUF2505)